LTGFHLERATFDPFVCRDAAGLVQFGDQRSTTGRHRDRVWPALSRYKRHRDKALWCSSRHTRSNRSIEAASLLTVLRHWYPCHPLVTWHIRQCDRAQRPPRYDP
jgi:hypothetical protein